MSFKPKNFNVWCEIPATDLERSRKFYSTVFDLELKVEEAGPNSAVFFPTEDDQGVAGHIYPGKPAADGKGPTVHFSVPDTVEKSMERVKSAGGTVLSDIIEIPSGRFAYCQDPDGNSIGLFSL